MAKRNISVEMEDVLISEIEREMVLSGFSTRSELIKTAIRYYIQVQHDRREQCPPEPGEATKSGVGMGRS